MGKGTRFANGPLKKNQAGICHPITDLEVLPSFVVANKNIWGYSLSFTK